MGSFSEKSPLHSSSQQAEQHERKSFFSSLSRLFQSTNPENEAVRQQNREHLQACAETKAAIIDNYQNTGYEIEIKKVRATQMRSGRPSDPSSRVIKPAPGVAEILSDRQLVDPDFVVIKGHKDSEIDTTLKSNASLGGISFGGVAVVLENRNIELLEPAQRNLGGKTSEKEKKMTYAHNEVLHSNLFKDLKFMTYLEGRASNQRDLSQKIYQISGGSLRRPIEVFEFLSDAASIAYNKGDCLRVMSNMLLSAKGMDNSNQEFSDGYLGTQRFIDQAIVAYANHSGRPEVSSAWNKLKQEYSANKKEMNKETVMEMIAKLEDFTEILGKQGAAFIQQAYKNQAKSVLKVIAGTEIN